MSDNNFPQITNENLLNNIENNLDSNLNVIIHSDIVLTTESQNKTIEPDEAFTLLSKNCDGLREDVTAVSEDGINKMISEQISEQIYDPSAKKLNESKGKDTCKNNDCNQKIDNEEQSSNPSNLELTESKNCRADACKSNPNSVGTNKNVNVSLIDTTGVITCSNIETTGLGFLQSQYSDSESDSNELLTPEIEGCNVRDSSSDSESIIMKNENYRDKIIEVDSDSSSDDLRIESPNEASDETDSEVNENVLNNECNVTQRKDPLKVKGELLLHELPPIQDLQISVPEEECVELGKVHSIIEQLVLVDSIPGTVPLNLETVLFLDKGQKVLGEVFDVIGQVSNPLYCVRFNSTEQILQKGIEIGQTVYVAPRTEHTQFVILSQLSQIRGSDASWEDDVEPPPRHIDFSDDEEERNYRRSQYNRQHNSRDNENLGNKKRSRIFKRNSNSATSSSYQHNADYYNAGVRGNENSRPFQQPQYQSHLQNQSTYNNMRFPPPINHYNLNNGSWHTNFNGNRQNLLENLNASNNGPVNQVNNQYLPQSYATVGGNYNQIPNFNTNNEQICPPPQNYLQQSTNESLTIPNDNSIIYPNPFALLQRNNRDTTLERTSQNVEKKNNK